MRESARERVCVCTYMHTHMLHDLLREWDKALTFFEVCVCVCVHAICTCMHAYIHMCVYMHTYLF
jgi:hypothetical protein